MQNDRTPLFLATIRGHTEIVAMLLKFGADFSICQTVSTSYYITRISTVSEKVDIYTFNIHLCVEILLKVIAITCEICVYVHIHCKGLHNGLKKLFLIRSTCHTSHETGCG